MTVRPETSVPEEGSFVVSVPESVAGCPLVTEVVPVYVSVVGAGVTVKVLDELFGSSCGIEVESPGNVAAIEYVPTGSFGVTGHEATPFGVRRRRAGLGPVQREGDRLVRHGLVGVGVDQRARDRRRPVVGARWSG